MPSLSHKECLIAHRKFQANMNNSQVARHFGCSGTAIRNLVEHHTETGSVDDRVHPGREEMSTPEQRRYIRLLHLRNRPRPTNQTAGETPERHHPRISSPIVKRRLQAHELRCRRTVRCNILTPIRRRRTLLWIQDSANWLQRRWNTVLFPDASRFCVDRPEGREHVWLTHGERYPNSCIREADRWGGPGMGRYLFQPKDPSGFAVRQFDSSTTHFLDSRVTHCAYFWAIRKSQGGTARQCLTAFGGPYCW